MSTGYQNFRAAVEAVLGDGSTGVNVPLDHLYLNTTLDTKNIRLNSRNFAATSGNFIAVQVKPAISVGGTGDVTGIEVSPRINSACNGGTMRGILAECYMKGSSGTLSGDVRCLQAQVTDENVAGRTVSGVVSMLDVWHQLAGHTLTGGVHVIHARTAGGGTGWTSFMRADASGDGGLVVSSDGMFKDPEGDTEAGYLKVYVGTTKYEIPIYASS